MADWLAMPLFGALASVATNAVTKAQNVGIEDVVNPINNKNRVHSQGQQRGVPRQYDADSDAFLANPVGVVYVDGTFQPFAAYNAKGHPSNYNRARTYVDRPTVARLALAK